MSVSIKYKGNEIAALTATGTKTLNTAGKYCEGDIVVENTESGGGVPTLQTEKTISVTANGTTEITPDAGYDGMKKVALTVAVPTGGSVDMRTINITVDGQGVSDIEGWSVDCWYGADVVTLDSGTPSASISVPNKTVFAITVMPGMFVAVSGADEAIQFDIAGVSGSYTQVNGSNFPDAFTYVCILNATVEDSSFTLPLSLSKNPNYQG